MHSHYIVAALKHVVSLGDSEDGQDLMEYGLLAALIAISALAAVATLGETIRLVFWERIGVWF